MSRVGAFGASTIASSSPGRSRGGTLTIAVSCERVTAPSGNVALMVIA
jgi:hypothetical protein